MKKTLIRSLALLLCLVLFVGLCACGGNNGGNTAGGGGSAGSEKKKDPKGVEKVRLEHVFTMDYLDAELPEGGSITNLRSVGDQIYISVYYFRELEDEAGDPIYENGVALYRSNADGTEFALLAEFPSVYEQDEEAGTSISKNVSTLAPDREGGYWYYSQETYEDWSDENNYVYESGGWLIHCDSSGAELTRVDINSLQGNGGGGFGGGGFGGGGFGGGVFISEMFVCEDGSLIISTGSQICALDSQGQLLYTVPLGMTMLMDMTITGAGDIIGLKSEYDMNTFAVSYKLTKLNTQTRMFEDAGEPPLANVFSLIGGPGHSLYFNSGSAIYGYDLETGTMSEVLNWINSDVNYSRVSMVTPMDSGSFALIESDQATGMYGGFGFGFGFGFGGGSQRLAVMNALSQEEVTEKYIIDFAAVTLDDQMQNAVIQFNKQSAEYRIRFKDYSVYNTTDNPNAGAEKLGYDLVSGEVPDIFSMSGLPCESYAAKGLLEDLSKRMTPEAGFDRSLYLENVLTATDYNGGIYSIIPTFTVNTVIGKSENVGAEPGWTIQDLQALMAKYPDASVFGDLDRGSILSWMSSMSMDSYVDRKSGTVSFDSPDFIAMLEFLGSFPDSIDWNNLYGNMGGDYWSQAESQFRDNRTLLMMNGLSGYSNCRTLEYSFGGEFTYIGFPCTTGIGSAIVPGIEVAVSSKTHFSDACWDFILFLLSEEYQDRISGRFPLRLSSLEKMSQAALTTEPQMGFGFYAEGDVRLEPPTEAQVAQINDLLHQVKSVQRDNRELLNILQEEAGAFFAGQKTAQAVATTIQSRAQIYVSENG